MSDDVLIVEGLEKRFGRVEALRGLSFTVPRGAFCGLFGRNGAGKTTALNAVTGLVPRDAGRVVVLGDDIRYEPRAETKARFAYVAGHLRLFHWMTCREHIDFVAKFYPTWDKAREQELLEMLHIPLKQRVKTLSTGQYIQLQLLMALAHRPELLLIDEPGNLDAVVRQRLMETMIAAIAEEETTIVMASHIISELDGVCDHLCIMDQGQTLVSGPVETTAASARRVRYRDAPPSPACEWKPEQWQGATVRFGRDRDGVWAVVAGYTPARAALLDEYVGTSSYEIEPLSLQDLFVALTEDQQAGEATS